MNEPKYYLSSVHITDREVMSDLNSGLKFEDLTLLLRFRSSGNTGKISNESIIKQTLEKLEVIVYQAEPDPLKEIDRLYSNLKNIIKEKTMREILNNTSAEDLRSSLNCSFNPEKSSDLHSDLEILGNSLVYEKSHSRRRVVIDLLESRIKAYRKFVTKHAGEL